MSSARKRRKRKSSGKPRNRARAFSQRLAVLRVNVAPQHTPGHSRADAQPSAARRTRGRALQRVRASASHPTRLYPSVRAMLGDSYSHSLPLPKMNMSEECSSSCGYASGAGRSAQTEGPRAPVLAARLVEQVFRQGRLLRLWRHHRCCHAISGRRGGRARSAAASRRSAHPRQQPAAWPHETRQPRLQAHAPRRQPAWQPDAHKAARR